jgi:hypothetical protein
MLEFRYRGFGRLCLVFFLKHKDSLKRGFLPAAIAI